MNKAVCNLRAPHLLITMPWGIGDTIAVGLSAVDQVVRNDPTGNVAVDILCNHLQATLLEHDPRINAIIAIDESLLPTAEEGTWKRGVFLSPEAAKLAEHLRQQDYTAVLPFFFGPGFFYVLHMPVLFLNVAEVWQLMADLHSFKDISMPKIVRHIVNKLFTKRMRAKRVPAPCIDEPIPLYLCPEHLQEAARYEAWIKARAGIAQEHRPLLLVAPDTSSSITRPPTSLLMQGIADALQRDPRLLVEILPGYTDKQAARSLWLALSADFPGRVLLLPDEPRMSLLELAAFIDQCDIFLTGDTGTMHLAAAYKVLPPTASSDLLPRNATKIIALFGGTHPYFHGYSQRSVIIGKGRREQAAFAPGIFKEIYHREAGKNFFDHITPQQITRAILE